MTECFLLRNAGIGETIRHVRIAYIHMKRLRHEMEVFESIDYFHSQLLAVYSDTTVNIQHLFESVLAEIEFPTGNYRPINKYRCYTRNFFWFLCLFQ
jgi:hypothetical protein